MRKLKGGETVLYTGTLMPALRGRPGWVRADWGGYTDVMFGGYSHSTQCYRKSLTPQDEWTDEHYALAMRYRLSQ
jgi:hypothetical protein